ncbi:DUF2357 domain-containing protein [Peptacetobacter sp.]|uniref:DUF2357 domain-containing protein n=1 Tax=Peptacetobacter sp. TaxID=2991975 RepID=UPI002608E0F5|nr:DUF2357 domain-containing protein [Peptacetobacter sp.]
MDYIDDYEKFCEAFNTLKEDDEQKIEAKLLLFVQNWIIKVLEHLKEDTLDYSLNKLIEQNKSEDMNVKKDVLSNIVDCSEVAFRRIEENMKEKIIRENVQMPVHKVRELNSYGLNWLTRKSGRTIRQKISSTRNSIMGVQRRMSLDTAENRLFIAFAKELYEQLDIKINNMPNDMIRIEEKELQEELFNFFKREDIKEVRRWENLPPNNTLLSDQNYRKIWNAWNELKKIDKKIYIYSKKLGECLATILYIELIGSLKDLLYIPQEPIEVVYDEYKIHTCSDVICCLDKSDNIVNIFRKNNFVEIKSEKNNIKVKFEGREVQLHINESEEKKYDLSTDDLMKIVFLILKELDLKLINKRLSNTHTEIKRFKNVIVDLFSLHPGYLGDNQNYNKLSERIMQQKYKGKDLSGEIREYYIPCDNANAIKMEDIITDTYTIPFVIDNGDIEKMKRLMYMMGDYIETDLFTYIFPDAYNELQLSMIHKAAKMVYHKVRNIPLSIGGVFKYQNTDDFVKNFKSDDFILVVNLIDSEITLTLVKGMYDEKLEKEIRDYEKVIWERHPTSTKSIKNEINKKIIKKLNELGCQKSEQIYKLFTIDGLKEEVNKLGIYFEDKWFRFTGTTKNIIDNFNIDISSIISEFIEQNKDIIKNSNVHIASIVDKLRYNGPLHYMYMNKQDVVEGCKNLIELESKSDIPLWHDYLPSLAIKLMYGKFDLIKNTCVEPRFGEKQCIPINGTFTLPKNNEEYHFNLVQDENARKMNYEAIIKSAVFPLNEDIECDLNMTYQYGIEEPYELTFIPKNYPKAKFKEIKAKWSKIEKYDIKNLKAPPFPRKLRWDELECFDDILHGDVINIFDKLKEIFELIGEGYYTVEIDSSEGRKNNGEVPIILNEEIVYVKWNRDKKNWMNGENPSQVISNISFWIKPIPKTKFYLASNICSSDTIPKPIEYLVNTYHRKWMRELFANNRSLKELGCPKEFKNIFEKAIHNWVQLFYLYDNKKLKKDLFIEISLAANDIGKEYYDVANELLRMYENKEIAEIPDEIGFGFCDLSNEMHMDLFNSTLKIVKKYHKKISILSKAIWHNENFVYRIDRELLLEEYLPKAIDCLGKFLQKDIKSKKDRRKIYYTRRYITYCLEFILGIFRLRQNCSDEIISKYLSLNNPKMQELYKYLEIIVDNNINLFSFLKIDIPSKGDYENICDLVYVVLVYLTGYSTDGEIKISLNTDEE